MNLQSVLFEDAAARGLGQLYTTAELLALAGPDWSARKLEQTVAQRQVFIRFKGGNSRVRVQPGTTRTAFLHRIGAEQYGWDAEAGVQAGLERWLQQRGYRVRAKFPDKPDLWRQLATNGLTSLDPIPGAGAACRDLVAHHPEQLRSSLEIWEVKGKTAVEGDMYETFGQL